MPRPTLATWGLRSEDSGSQTPIRVVIVDGQNLVREGLAALLSRQPHVAIVGEAASARQLTDIMADLAPDVVLLDVALTDTDSIDVIRTVRQRWPSTRVLLLAVGGDEGRVFTALRAGAKGYVTKNASGTEVTKAIGAVHRGEMWAERSFIARFFEAEASRSSPAPVGDPSGRPLTEREKDIVRVLVSGATNKDIAQALAISEKTVKSHLTSIFRKLQVSRRLEAALQAIQRGLIAVACAPLFD
jgi:DNA-binding NarL/FixJ family response regulator